MKLKRAFTVLAGAFLSVFLLSAVGVLIDQNSQSGIGGLLFLLGLLGFVIGILVGFALWASAKGYSPWLGVVLAWIGPFGGRGKETGAYSAEYVPFSFSLPVATPVGIRSVRPSPSSAKAPFSAAVVARLVADFEVSRETTLCQFQAPAMSHATSNGSKW